MNSGLVKVLLIDRDPERRNERISVLKKHGYKVFPALDIQQARSRCKPGAFDLIVVNSGGQPEMALELCEWIKANDPQQAILLMAAQLSNYHAGITWFRTFRSGYLKESNPCSNVRMSPPKLLDRAPRDNAKGT